MNEEWRQLEFAPEYEVSNRGNFRRGNFVIKQRLSRCGYPCVSFSVEKKRRVMEVHRLVAIAFIPNPNGHRYVNHINEVKTDNRVENLEWCDISYNLTYGDRIPNAKKTREITRYIEKILELEPNRLELINRIIHYGERRIRRVLTNE